MQTHGDKFFIGFGKLRKTWKIIFRDKTREIEHPYREARSVVVQYIPRFGAVMGRWKNPKHLEEEQDYQLLEALMGRELSVHELLEQQEKERRETAGLGR